MKWLLLIFALAVSCASHQSVKKDYQDAIKYMAPRIEPKQAKNKYIVEPDFGD